LRADISKAQKGDTIVFAPILAGKSITLTSGELVVNKNLTIQGPGASQLTISGGKASRVFEVDGAKTIVSLSGLTMTQGNGQGGTLPGHGGAVFNNGSTLTITNSIFSGNSANAAGGAVDNHGTLTITNSTFSGNSAGSGGAIANYANLTINGGT